MLKATAEYLDLSLGDLLEGMVLHAFEGKAPFSKETLERGVVEVDEAFVGGKPRRPAKAHPGDEKIGRKYRRGPAPDFGDRKTPVIALVERGGHARAFTPTDVTGSTLKDAIRRNVASSATIMTDERSGYRGIGREYAGGHHTVKHSAGEYMRGDIGSNQVESYFALLKRSIVGQHHNVSRRHLDRYCDDDEGDLRSWIRRPTGGPNYL